MKEKRLKFVVKGLVQGVGFRYFVLKSATELNLNGYVKNQIDDSVVGVAEGKKESIEKFKLLLVQGPPRSRIDKVKFEEDEPEGHYLTFSIH